MESTFLLMQPLFMHTLKRLFWRKSNIVLFILAILLSYWHDRAAIFLSGEFRKGPASFDFNWLYVVSGFSAYLGTSWLILVLQAGDTLAEDEKSHYLLWVKTSALGLEKYGMIHLLAQVFYFGAWSVFLWFLNLFFLGLHGKIVWQGQLIAFLVSLLILFYELILCNLIRLLLPKWLGLFSFYLFHLFLLIKQSSLWIGEVNWAKLLEGMAQVPQRNWKEAFEYVFQGWSDFIFPPLVHLSIISFRPILDFSWRTEAWWWSALIVVQSALLFLLGKFLIRKIKV